MKKIIDWIVFSSADPNKTALTVKAGLLGILPIVMLVSGIAKDDANSLVEGISNAVFLGLSLVSVSGIVYGLGRKIWLTVR